MQEKPTFQFSSNRSSLPNEQLLNLTLIQTAAYQLPSNTPIYRLFLQATSKITLEAIQIRTPGCLRLIEEFINKRDAAFNFKNKEDCKRAIFEATLRGICEFAGNAAYSQGEAQSLVWGYRTARGGYTPNAIDFASQYGEEFKPQELYDALLASHHSEEDFMEAQLKAAFVRGWGKGMFGLEKF